MTLGDIVSIKFMESHITELLSHDASGEGLLPLVSCSAVSIGLE